MKPTIARIPHACSGCGRYIGAGEKCYSEMYRKGWRGRGGYKSRYLCSACHRG